MRQLSDPNAFARALRARLRAEGASNLVQNSSCETEKGYGFWQDRRFGNGSGGLAASVGARGAALSPGGESRSAAIEASASPRNPSVPIAPRSSAQLILLVA